jgi:hypothetical protein
MDANALLSDFRSRGIDLVPNGEKLTVTPSSRLTDDDRAVLRAYKCDLLRILSRSAGTPEHVIEATFRDAPATISDQAISPEFPPCPVCGATRYWISRGLVLCGSKRCGSAARFVLTSIEFRAVQ